MRIAYVSGSYLPSRQANSIHVMRMCEAFAGLGHEVKLFGHAGDAFISEPLAKHYDVSDRFEVVAISPTRSARGRELSYALRLRRRVTDWLPELIYGRHLLGILACSRIGPCVYELHSIQRGLSGRLEAGLLRRPAIRGIVAISSALARDIRSQYSVRAPLVVEPDAVNPVDYGHVEPAPLPGSGVLKLGYGGHLYPGRGWEILLEIARRRPAYDVHLVGGEPRDIARCRSAAEGLKNVFFHGFVSPGEVPRYLAAADVLLAPYQSRIEAFGKEDIAAWISPMKLFEYMDAGKPIAVSDLPVLREIVTHEETALLAPPDNLDAWCGLLDRLRCPTLRAKLGDAAQSLVRQRYTWGQRARRILDKVNSPGGSV